MNAYDYVVLFGSLLGIAIYGIWRTRGRENLDTYLKGRPNTPWLVIGISVMATQASAITFLSTPGQGFNDGLGFTQNYFGMPFALILVAAVFLPIYRKLKVYTAYEYLGKRFDSKTRLLGAVLFLLQRALGAGITIYAPAIVLSTVFGWRLDVTIICTGLLVVVYTVVGGSEAVNVTQKYQFAVIFAGMVLAMIILIARLPHQLSLLDALTVAGRSSRLKGVDFSTSLKPRYTFWSGLIGGIFLQLSYFGTDQSQVQRYISGSSLRESRLGLMFNAVMKIPMQFFILLLGVLIFVFYQFNAAPIYFNHSAWVQQESGSNGVMLRSLQADFRMAQTEKQLATEHWLAIRKNGSTAQTDQAWNDMRQWEEAGQKIHNTVSRFIDAHPIGTKSNENEIGRAHV